jgi:hypothetical protein
MDSGGFMATKSEQFQAEQARAATKAKRQKKAKIPAKAAAEPRLTHNEAHRLDRKSTHALEEVGKHASRKSTRDSANRSKSDSTLRLTVRIRNATPEARATRKTGNPM